VNRRLDEALRPFPRLIRLGTLREIARELGLRDHDTDLIREAIHQNAKAYIRAKIKVKCVDRSERWMEIGGTRYSVILTGQKLPDGSKADAVYLDLHGTFRELLDQAQTRPLDYNLLRALPVASQRLYELLSHAMFAALKQGGGPARLCYGKFCELAPQVRYRSLWESKRQMERLHKPLIHAGYVGGPVGFEVTRDREGRADWIMLYPPGWRAWDEYKTFNRRRQLAADRAPLPVGPPPIEPPPIELPPLVAELVGRGVSPGVAAELVAEFTEERIRAQLASLDWYAQHPPRKPIGDPAAWLVDAIKGAYAQPAGMAAAARRAERRAAEEARAAADRAAKARQCDEQARVAAYWEGLSDADRAALEAAALEHADDLAREQIAKGRPKFVEAMRQSLRDDEIRRRLELPLPS
jgi:hypothetical protein